MAGLGRTTPEGVTLLMAPEVVTQMLIGAYLEKEKKKFTVPLDHGQLQKLNIFKRPCATFKTLIDSDFARRVRAFPPRWTPHYD